MRDASHQVAAVVDGLDGRHGGNHLICELLQRLR